MRNKHAYHGRSHRPGGSDPLWPSGGEAIRFDTDNVGGWLDIRTTGTDGDGYGIQLVSSDDVLIQGTNTLTVQSDSVTIDATNSAGQLLLHSDQNGFLKSEKNMVVEGGINAGTTGSGVVVQATHGVLSLLSVDGSVDVQQNGSGNMTFTSNGSITFDSGSGQAVVVSTLGNVISLLQSYGLAA